MRKSIDGLVGLVKGLLQEDVHSGDLFLFFNRRGSYLKCVAWDRTGFLLFAKRLERGHEKLLQWRDQMQKNLVWNIEQGLGLTPHDIGRGEELRTILWHRVRIFFERYDLLVLPTVAVKPFPVEQPHPAEINGHQLANYTQWFFLTYAISLTGLPAISVPCGFTRDGLPVGLQIVGRRRQESAVLTAAAAFERAAPWADRVPPTVGQATAPRS